MADDLVSVVITHTRAAPRDVTGHERARRIGISEDSDRSAARGGAIIIFAATRKPPAMPPPLVYLLLSHTLPVEPTPHRARRIAMALLRRAPTAIWADA